MIDHLSHPTVLQAHGSPPKQIAEHVGLASTGTDALSIAVMESPAGWTEPAQVPDFDEWTVVISGTLRVVHRAGAIDVRAGEAVHVPAGVEVRYATPDEPAQYVSVCMPAFSPAAVHRVPGSGGLD